MVEIITTSPFCTGKSTALASQIGERLTDHEIVVNTTDLRTLPPFMAGKATAHYPAEVQKFETAIREADAVILATGIYRGFATAAALNAMCLVRDGLKSKPVLVCAAAGSVRAHGCVEQLRQLLWSHYQSEVMPAVMFSPDVDPEDITRRVDDAATRLATMLGVTS